MLPAMDAVSSFGSAGQVASAAPRSRSWGGACFGEARAADRRGGVGVKRDGALVGGPALAERDGVVGGPALLDEQVFAGEGEEGCEIRLGGPGHLAVRPGDGGLGRGGLEEGADGARCARVGPGRWLFRGEEIVDERLQGGLHVEVVADRVADLGQLLAGGAQVFDELGEGFLAIAEEHIVDKVGLGEPSRMTMHTFAPPGTDLRPRLERNDRGRDFVVAGVHAHFAMLRRALAELEVNEHDRVFSLGNLVDGGPRSFDALDWTAGADPSTRFHAGLRGHHEQMMLEALLMGTPDELGWMADGGTWWTANGGHRTTTVKSATTRYRARFPAIRTWAAMMAGPAGAGSRNMPGSSPNLPAYPQPRGYNPQTTSSGPSPSGAGPGTENIMHATRSSDRNRRSALHAPGKPWGRSCPPGTSTPPVRTTRRNDEHPATSDHDGDALHRV